MEKGRESANPPLVRLVFSVLWDELRETIGTAPTATLLRRAIVISREACPILEQITIDRDGREYRYSIPPDADMDPQTYNNIGQFVDNVLTLLSRLTGKVLVRKLLANPLVRQLASKE